MKQIDTIERLNYFDLSKYIEITNIKQSPKQRYHKCIKLPIHIILSKHEI